MLVVEKEIKNLKKLCLKKQYCCVGEIYKLLDDASLINLIKKISDDKFIYLKEVLINNLDKYIGYVRDTYFIKHYELCLILNERLRNKYSKYLLKEKNIHQDFMWFKLKFKQIFLYNIVLNTKYLVKYDTNKEYIYLEKAYKFLQDKDFKNDEDIEKIEKFYIKLINNRDDTIYYGFKNYKKVSKEKIKFYLKEFNFLYEEYYKYSK